MQINSQLEEFHRTKQMEKSVGLPYPLCMCYQPGCFMCSAMQKLSEPSFCGFLQRLHHISIIEYIIGCWWSTQTSATLTFLEAEGGAEMSQPFNHPWTFQ